MQILKAYDRQRVQKQIVGESLTSQAHKRECDINAIMLKWQKTGTIEHRNTFEGQYGDFSEAPGDYHDAMNQVVAANEMFETLPAKVRRQFGNDPGAFLDFAQDPQNLSAMVDLGLATKRASEASETLSERASAKAPKQEPKTKSEDPSDP